MGVQMNITTIFLGLAEHVTTSAAPFPIGPIDLYRVAWHKPHLFFPISIGGYEWLFIFGKDVVSPPTFDRFELRILDPNEDVVGYAKFTTTEMASLSEDLAKKRSDEGWDAVFEDEPTFLFRFKIDGSINKPGKYKIVVRLEEDFQEIGVVNFAFQPPPPITADQALAIESNPNSVKSVIIELGCKNCSTKLRVYSSARRQPKLEKSGIIWQHDVPESFNCECGSTNYSLEYVQKGLHGLLLKNLDKNVQQLSYVRRYGHEQIISIVNDFNLLLDKEKNEPPIQKFIEENPVMLAQFRAKRVFIKPRILGKFECDFAIIDTQNQLLLIEIEKPSMQLFTQKNRPTSQLMHAYGQVNDWLLEIEKHHAACLDGLGLVPDDVFAIKGAVIAGRNSADILKPLQKHLSKPPYPSIDFYTFDDLSASVIEISRQLA